jgi:hypothetical protein
MCEGWKNKFFNLVGHAHPSICDRVMSKGRSYCPYCYPARCRWLPTSYAYSTETCSAPGAFTEHMKRPHYWPEDHCRVHVWSWVEHQTQSATLVLKRQLTLRTFTILNWKYSMFVCSSLYRYDLIYFICYLLYDL